MIPGFPKQVECVECGKWGGVNCAVLSWSAHPDNGPSGKRCPACYQAFDARRQMTLQARLAASASEREQQKTKDLKQRVTGAMARYFENHYAEKTD